MNKIEISCLLCGKSAGLKYDGLPGYQEPDTFRIFHCPHCNTGFPLPHLDTSVIYENIYKNAERVPGYNRYWRYARFIKEFTNPFEYLSRSSEPYWAVKEALSVFPEDKKPKILEIGSGLGYLTYSMIKANYDIVGLDVSDTAVNHAKENFGDHYICADLFDYARQNEASYDAVLLTEVIEHIDKPVQYIELIMKLLKPSGLAIISTPDKSFYPEDIVWATDLPPVHNWWFSETSMMYIANLLNIKISFINFTNFYKKNYKAVNLKSKRNDNLPGAFFNKDGELIAKAARSKKTLKLHIQILIDRVPFANLLSGVLSGKLKMLFGKARELFENDLIVCRERGTIMCAVMQKPPTP